ncbi:MAG: metal-sensitive transcriptional regulator [Anaerolineae bacterium]
MNTPSPALKADMQLRLRRIEGQLRGVQKMLDEDRDCREIVQQLNAVRAALQNASSLFLRSYVKDCLLRVEEIDAAARGALVDDLVELVARLK